MTIETLERHSIDSEGHFLYSVKDPLLSFSLHAKR